MRKIEQKDVLDLTGYEKQRKEFRQKIMAVKEKRRIHVGPWITYLFENYDTMWYQVQEMTRAERIVDEKGIQGELNAYNELIPEKNQLSASMLIEIDDITERKTFLTRVVDLPQHTYLSLNGEKNMAVFDPRQGSEDKLSAVQYIKFSLTQTQADAFGVSESKVIFGFDHCEYSHEYELTSEQKSVLFEDMRA